MGNTKIKDKNEQFSLPWENINTKGGGYGDLPDNRINRLNMSVNRMNADLFAIRQNGGIPKVYFEYAKDLCDHWMNSAEYDDSVRKNTAITIGEEAYVLDREKARTYYDVNVAAQIFAPVTRVLNQFKWDIKHYMIQKVANVVKFSRNFDSPRFIQAKLSNQLDKGVGWYLGYSLSRWDLLENKGELFDLQYETMLEAAAQMGRTAHEHILTGTTIEHGGTDDLGEAGSGMSITGFMNHASLQSFTYSTPSTYGNTLKALKEGLADLKKVFATKDVILISSGGVPDQAEQNYSTYDQINEMDEIQKRLVGPDKRIKEWWVTDQITGAAISTSTQVAILLKRDPRLMSRLIILGLQTLASEKKNWRDDVSEVMLAADCIRYNKYDSTENAFPATSSGAVTTAGLGSYSNERIA